jgi:hypothetical protein
VCHWELWAASVLSQEHWRTKTHASGTVAPVLVTHVLRSTHVPSGLLPVKTAIELWVVGDQAMLPPGGVSGKTCALTGDGADRTNPL